MPETMTIARKVSGRRFSVEVPAEREPDGELSVSLEHARAAELAIAAALATEGPLDGESFRYMRGALGIEARRLAELIGVSAETVSRWENDVSPVSRAAWLMLGTLVMERAGRGPGSLERLQHLAEGEPPPKDVRLTLDRAA
jgi:DNA-binding transcriptional regulator YiaG